MAETKACKLCALAKKMGAGSPCNIYCLNPMKAMVKALDEDYSFKIEETLFNEGKKCCVKINK